MTTEQPTTALAHGPLSDKQIRTRIELNKQAGWGLEKGSQAQLNMVFLICQKYELLPGDDITLYDGKPWITIDGRVKMMRRHPDYLSFKNRPLSKDEKEEWGYDPDDIVIECTIKMRSGAEISARGKVSKAEREGASAERQRLNYVARIHPVEMAEKRAIARAERFAFGQDAVIDDEQADEIVRTVIQERHDQPGLNAAEYGRVFGSDNDADIGANGNPEPEHESQEVPEQEAVPVDVSTGEVTAEEPDRDAALEEWVLVSGEATRLGIAHKQLPTNASIEQVTRWTNSLSEKVYEKREAVA